MTIWSNIAYLGLPTSVSFRTHGVTPERRAQVVVNWRDIHDRIASGDANGAEARTRDLMLENRDEVLSRLTIPGSPPPDQRRAFR